MGGEGFEPPTLSVLTRCSNTELTARSCLTVAAGVSPANFWEHSFMASWFDNLARFFRKSPDMKTRTPLILITFALVCFAPLQNTQAVNPPPDGGYPGGNTAEGYLALGSLTTGAYNTANGSFALFGNTIGERNTATGDSALFNNNTGSRNTANGNPALVNNTAGDDNTAIGAFALQSNTTGDQNTATGVQALSSNTTGIVNTATGYQALQSNTNGTSNTADGVGALQDTTTGGGNTATGYQALLHNDSGDYNTAIGLFALGSLTTGGNNTGLGRSAGTSVTTADHVICIGDNVSGANVSNSCYIGSIFGQTSSVGAAVFINNSGKLGTTTSSRRFKEEIKRMGTASEALFALQPVTFRYKKEIDPQSTSQFGLVAEEVEKVNPDLVVRDTDGKPYTVRYDQVNAMLLNEFLKVHRKVEEQEKTMAELKSGMTALVATVKEQAAQIQKVSAQLEASKPAPQVVNNP